MIRTSFALVITTPDIAVGAQQSSDQGSPAGETAPQTPDELQARVAPIALYPDALVAQILGASTFPDRAAVANYKAPDGSHSGTG